MVKNTTEHTVCLKTLVFRHTCHRHFSAVVFVRVTKYSSTIKTHTRRGGRFHGNTYALGYPGGRRLGATVFRWLQQRLHERLTPTTRANTGRPANEFSITATVERALYRSSGGAERELGVSLPRVLDSPRQAVLGMATTPCGRALFTQHSVLRVRVRSMSTIVTKRQGTIPYATRERGYQVRFSVYICKGIVWIKIKYNYSTFYSFVLDGIT
jgi:hypothetical protein